MAFAGKKGTKLGIKLGDKAYGEVKLFDSKWLAKGNGIYAEFASQAARETFAATAGAFLIAAASSAVLVFLTNSATITHLSVEFVKSTVNVWVELSPTESLGTTTFSSV